MNKEDKNNDLLDNLLWNRPYDFIYFIKNNFIYLNDFHLSIYNKKPKAAPKVKSLKSLLKHAGGMTTLTEKTSPTKKKYKNVYCVNCGEKGHVVKDCDGPITSFGIIAFKVVNNYNEEMYDKNPKLKKIVEDTLTDDASYPKIKFLMIQRKDTMGYIDFIRGKYPDDNEEEKSNLLSIWLNEMTLDEKDALLTKPFDTLWDNLWINHESKCYRNEYTAAKRKFERLELHTLVNSSSGHYEFQELGFAKGRRNMREQNIACAEREFHEETGYKKKDYEFVKNYPMIQEEFMGTNGIRYRHIYYLVKMRDNIHPPTIDQNNIVQTGEVQNIGWLTYEECIKVIRPYDHAKKEAITQVYEDILSMNNKYICSNYYITKR